MRFSNSKNIDEKGTPKARHKPHTPSRAGENAGHVTGVPFFLRKSVEVSHSTDPDEREADQIARKVVDGQPADIHGGFGTGSRRTESSGETTRELQSKLENSKGSGQSLDDPFRSEMESSLGADFSHVKIHTDGQARDLNEGVNAKAFTHGRDIFFGAGQFSTNSKAGKELLAHELAHTIQQGEVGAYGQIQRQTGAGAKTEREKIEAALESKDPADVKKIDDVNQASEAEKLELIRILVNQGWVGPRDEWKVEELWNSFGSEILLVKAKEPALWSQCLDRGAELEQVVMPALEAGRSTLEKTTAPGSGKSFGEVASGFAKLKDVSHDIAVTKTGIGIYEGDKCETRTPDTTATNCTNIVLEILRNTFAQQGRSADWAKVEKKYAQNKKARGAADLSGLDVQAALQSECSWKGIYWATDPTYLIPKEQLSGWDAERQTGIRETEASFTSAIAKSKGTYYKDFGKKGYPGVSIAHLVTNYAPEAPKPAFGEASKTKKDTSQLQKLKKLPFGILAGHGGHHMTIITYGKVIEVHWNAPATSVDVIEQTDFDQWAVGQESGYHYFASGAIVAPAGDVDAAFK